MSVCPGTLSTFRCTSDALGYTTLVALSMRDISDLKSDKYSYLNRTLSSCSADSIFSQAVPKSIYVLLERVNSTCAENHNERLEIIVYALMPLCVLFILRP